MATATQEAKSRYDKIDSLLAKDEKASRDKIREANEKMVQDRFQAVADIKKSDELDEELTTIRDAARDAEEKVPQARQEALDLISKAEENMIATGRRYRRTMTERDQLFHNAHETLRSTYDPNLDEEKKQIIVAIRQHIRDQTVTFGQIEAVESRISALSDDPRSKATIREHKKIYDEDLAVLNKTHADRESVIADLRARIAEIEADKMRPENYRRVG